MSLKLDASVLAAAIRSDVNELTDLKGYGNSAVCLIDAVFSINLDYVHQVGPMCSRCEAEFGAVGVQDLKTLVEYFDDRGTSAVVVTPMTSHRTPGRSSILKAEAVRLEADILLSHGINTCADICASAGDAEVAYDFRSVTGQTDVALWYLFMLAGRTAYAKPDRRLWGYIVGHGIRPRSNLDALTLIREASGLLGRTPREIDHSLWTST